MADSKRDLALPDATATDALGAALAGSRPRPTPHGAVLYLSGELGAGKTTCARSLLRTLGVTGLIRSPTYTLLETYELESGTCVHLDLYRLRSLDEVDELGLRDYLEPNALLLIEWPEKGGNSLPTADLELAFRYDQESRAAQLRASSAFGRSWLRNLADDASLTPYVPN